jgi:hypothetical protein
MENITEIGYCEKIRSVSGKYISTGQASEKPLRGDGVPVLDAWDLPAAPPHGSPVASWLFV